MVQSEASFSDLFSAPQQPTPAQQPDPWGTTETNNNFDPFASQQTNQQAAFDDFQPQAANQQVSFDPLAEFDNLHIQQPVANGNAAAVSQPNFFLDQTLLATSSNGAAPAAVQPVVQETAKAPNGNGFFDGAMNDLVNMDILLPSKPVTNPYEMTKDPNSNGMTTRNPFMVRGPQPSLNQLSQNGNGNLFADQGSNHNMMFGGQNMMQPVNGNFINSQNPF